MKWAGSARESREAEFVMRAPVIFEISRSVILGWVAFVDPAEKPRSHEYNVDLQSA